ncbi:MAG: hypothetical protein ACLFRI_06080 [Candidatus Izemoplasmataceae bacterium]
MGLLSILLYTTLYLVLASIAYLVPTYIGKIIIKDFQKNKRLTDYLLEYIIALIFIIVALSHIMSHGYNQILAGVILYFGIIFTLIRLYQMLIRDQWLKR